MSTEIVHVPLVALVFRGHMFDVDQGFPDGCAVVQVANWADALRAVRQKPVEAEQQRVASDGTPHACSMLLGACARAAKAIGARRIITYTLDSESGSSLKGAGWVREVDGITSWWTSGTSRTPAIDRPHMAEGKVRWALHFTGVPRIELTATPAAGTPQLDLFGTAS